MEEKAKRWTKERQQIFDFFDANHLVSAPMLESKFPHIGRASIFRTLKTFTELGILRRVNLGKPYDEYELVETNEEHHHEHIRCVKCDTVVSFDSGYICGLLSKVAESHGFMMTEHSIGILGICERCQKLST